MNFMTERGFDRRLWAPACAVAGLALVAFLPALSGGFVWDDRALVEGCNGIKGLDARHLRWMLTTNYMANYQPLGWLSLALDYRIWGLRPAGFHPTNQLLHACNAALVFLIGRLLLERASPLRGSALSWGATAAALLFALHPARAESVAWISERRDVLSGLFYLLCIWFHIQGRRAASIACCAASLLCKAVAVSLPLVLLILDLYPLGRLPRDGWRRLILEKLPYAALALAGTFMVLWAQHSTGNLVPLEKLGWGPRLAQAVIGLGFYLEKSLLPIRLSPLYPLAETVTGLAVLRASAVLAGAETLLRWARVGRAPRLALWSYYLVALAPMLGLVQNGPQAVAVRYSYLSCLGWALAAGAGVARLPPRARGAAGTVLLLLLSAASWRECRYWRDEPSLWRRAVSVLPGSAELRSRLGAVFAEQGRTNEAAAALDEALRLQPGHARARRDRAQLLYAAGRFPEAERDFRAALSSEPDSAEALSNVGAIIAQQGREAEALPFLERAAALNPGNAVTEGNLMLARAGLEKNRR